MSSGGSGGGRGLTPPPPVRHEYLYVRDCQTIQDEECGKLAGLRSTFLGLSGSRAGLGQNIRPVWMARTQHHVYIGEISPICLLLSVSRFPSWAFRGWLMSKRSVGGRERSCIVDPLTIAHRRTYVAHNVCTCVYCCYSMSSRGIDHIIIMGDWERQRQKERERQTEWHKEGDSGRGERDGGREGQWEREGGGEGQW